MCPPPTELRRGGPAFMVARSQTRPRPVPAPSGKVLAKLRGKGLAKLNAKTPGKAARQWILGRAAKLPSVRKSTVRCGHSFVTQGIVYCQRPSYIGTYITVLALLSGGSDLLIKCRCSVFPKSLHRSILYAGVVSPAPPPGPRAPPPGDGIL